MNKTSFSLTITFIILTLALISGERSIVAERGTNSSYDIFLENPSLASWHRFESDIRSGHYDSLTLVFRDVLEYHDARLKRDLPNSMALIDVNPKNFVEKQQKRTNSALLSIKAKESDELWRLLEKLAIQDFDEDLMWTACEITARLSPTQFDIIAIDVQRLHPNKEKMIKMITRKWLIRKR